MERYPSERREWVLRKMMARWNQAIVDLSEETGILAVTLDAWRKQARAAGVVMPRDGKIREDLVSADKVRLVPEVACLNETVLAEHCRRKELYLD